MHSDLMWKPKDVFVNWHFAIIIFSINLDFFSSCFPYFSLYWHMAHSNKSWQLFSMQRLIIYPSQLLKQTHVFFFSNSFAIPWGTVGIFCVNYFDWLVETICSGVNKIGYPAVPKNFFMSLTGFTLRYFLKS